MPLIYLTGISGSGKSAVIRELQARGYEAHGVDEMGYADWVDRQTGKIIPFPEDENSVDIHEWYKKHNWVLSDDRISKLKQQADANDTLIFLAGVADGEDTVWHYFGKVFVLNVDEATIRQRIAKRTDNDFGKTPDEMAAILRWLDGYEERYRTYGAVIVDATKPLNEVVDEIVRKL